MIDLLSDHEIAVYRVEINGKLWNLFTDRKEADETIARLKAQGMDGVIVTVPRKAA